MKSKNDNQSIRKFGYGMLALNSTNDNQSSKRISYGILIDADANTKTGYNGADYDFYIEIAGG
ncbi:MAG: hypothetical protein ACTHJ2_03690, partial [Candidatus Nitrosocosmicus sp.]